MSALIRCSILKRKRRTGERCVDLVMTLMLYDDGLVPRDGETGKGARKGEGSKYDKYYTFSTQNICAYHIFSRTLSLLSFTQRRYGSALEIEASGMLRACFAEDGKLQELDVMFDGVSVHQQIQKAIRVRRFLLMFKTLSTAAEILAGVEFLFFAFISSLATKTGSTHQCN